MYMHTLLPSSPKFSLAAFWIYVSGHRIVQKKSLMEHQPLSKSAIFVVGDMVVVHALQGRAELNGQTGTLLSFDAGKGRWAIHLAAETVSIKPGTI